MSARSLVVDDILANRRLMQAKLEAKYYTVLLAENGVQALQVAETEQPEIILLDVMMPGMDGPETFLALRKLPGLENTPAIFMTAKVMESEVARFKELGALGVIPKPFDPMTLSEQIKSLWDENSG